MSATPTHGALLACGIAVDDLLEQVADRLPAGDPEHQGSCVHCRAMLAELTSLWAPVHAAAAERVRAPAGLLDRVAERVHDLAANSWYAVLEGERGVTRIAAWVVAAVARLAAARVPGVAYTTSRAGNQPQPANRPSGRPGGRLAGRGAQAAGVGVAGRRTVIDLELVAELGPELPALADRVRAQVSRDIAAMTGLEVVEVNITIADLDVQGDEGGPGAGRG